MAYVYALDPTTPASTDFARNGDDEIRNFKAAVRERLLSFFADVDADPMVTKNGAQFGSSQHNDALVGNTGADKDLYLQTGSATGRVVVRNHAAVELFAVTDAGSAGLLGNFLLESNNTFVQGKTSGGTTVLLVGVDATNKLLIDNNALGTRFGGTATVGTIQTGSGALLNLGDGTAMEGTFGFTPNSNILGTNSALSFTTGSGTYLHTHLLTKQTVATTGTAQGLETWTWAAHSSGTVTGIYGLIGNLAASGGGTVTKAFGMLGGGIVSAGSTITDLYSVRGGGVTVDGAGSHVTHLYCLHAAHPTAQNSGTIDIAYGVYIDNLTQATTNIAIYVAGTNDVILNGTGALLANNAAVGFLYMAAINGTPTGVPANTATGIIPVAFDPVHNCLVAYNGGWKSSPAFI